MPPAQNSTCAYAGVIPKPATTIGRVPIRGVNESLQRSLSLAQSRYDLKAKIFGLVLGTIGLINVLGEQVGLCRLLLV